MSRNSDLRKAIARSNSGGPLIRIGGKASEKTHRLLVGMSVIFPGQSIRIPGSTCRKDELRPTKPVVVCLRKVTVAGQ